MGMRQATEQQSTEVRQAADTRQAYCQAGGKRPEAASQAEEPAAGKRSRCNAQA